MITLRGDLATAKLRTACKHATGLALPAPGKITGNAAKGLAWMSPDELLVLVPHAGAGAVADQMAQTLAGTHHLAANVSDARALISVAGPHAREVLAKVSPVDMHPGSFAAGDFRRSRIGQVAGAFWIDADEVIRVICFRSQADYVFTLLAKSAEDGAVGFLG
jgi:sarcosine oxidase subunit gamma